ncbi:MAG: RNA polymerase factor sigma-54 [Bacteroidota bacterium]
MLNQKLQQKLLQKLSPQQIQLIKLLEIPSMQLEQRIKKELEENPALEEGDEDDFDPPAEQEEEISEKEKEKEQDEFSFEDYLNDEDTPYYKLSSTNYSKDDERKDIPYSIGSTFHEELERQAGLRNFDDTQRKLASYIIGSIDEDGYLRRDIDAMVDDVAFMLNITTTENELTDVLRVIHDFDPPGVGARDLKECLLLQLERKDLSDPAIDLAIKTLKLAFTEFTKKHYEKILKKFNVTEDDLKDAISEITRLNPKPGSSFSDPHNKTTHHISPDFILENNEGEIILSLNTKNAPDLRISRKYLEMLEVYSYAKDKATREQKDAVTFVKQKLDSAKWFIDAIKQRQNTMILTMNAILDFQKEYFTDGDETKLHPMILKDIADKTGLDISTISRVANSKYIQTHFGIFPLKFFFSEGMQTDTGEEVSTREIKKILQDCIENEDKRKPLTDDRLAAILKDKGYVIARRTVAKYREQLNIPVGRMRKQI